jgi:hypothetical protein
MNPPEILYHYTTQPGLLGILKTDSLWATKIHYLNDTAEFELAFGLARELLERMGQGESDQKNREKITTLQENLRRIERLNICVTSLSANRDLLSQWRAYGGGVAGFSLGLRTDELMTQCEGQNFFLAKCIYDAKQHAELVEQLVVQSLAVDFNTQGAMIHPDKPRTLVALPTGGNFKNDFARLAPTLKNHAFHEEDEWRLISARGINSDRLSFRPGHSMLIPYASFALGEKKSYLESVTVGPTPHMALAVESTRTFLGHLSALHGVDVLPSDAPYRAW